MFYIVGAVAAENRTSKPDVVLKSRLKGYSSLSLLVFSVFILFETWFYFLPFSVFSYPLRPLPVRLVLEPYFYLTTGFIAPGVFFSLYWFDLTPDPLEF